jgi:hypothetical protein
VLRRPTRVTPGLVLAPLVTTRGVRRLELMKAGETLQF